MMNKFIFSIAVILTAMLGQQCSRTDIEEELPLRDFLEGGDRVIYIEGNIFLDMYEKDDQLKRKHERAIGMPVEERYYRYREEITGARLKQLREFLLGYSCITRRETPIEKEQIIHIVDRFRPTDGSYLKLLIPGKKGKEVIIWLETEEEAEKFYMTVGREGTARDRRQLRLMREREKGKKQ